MKNDYFVCKSLNNIAQNYYNIANIDYNIAQNHYNIAQTYCNIPNIDYNIAQLPILHS